MPANRFFRLTQNVTNFDNLKPLRWMEMSTPETVSPTPAPVRRRRHGSMTVSSICEGRTSFLTAGLNEDPLVIEIAGHHHSSSRLSVNDFILIRILSVRVHIRQGVYRNTFLVRLFWICEIGF